MTGPEVRDPHAPRVEAACDLCVTRHAHPAWGAVRLRGPRTADGPVFAFGPFNAHRGCYDSYQENKREGRRHAEAD